MADQPKLFATGVAIFMSGYSGPSYADRHRTEFAGASAIPHAAAAIQPTLEGWVLYAEEIPQRSGSLHTLIRTFGQLALEIFRPAAASLRITAFHAKQMEGPRKAVGLLSTKTSLIEGRRSKLKSTAYTSGRLGGRTYLIGKLKDHRNSAAKRGRTRRRF